MCMNNKQCRPSNIIIYLRKLTIKDSKANTAYAIEKFIYRFIINTSKSNKLGTCLNKTSIDMPI